ncbi:MAG: hypothetical protein ACU0BS_07835 [Hasllibacter sp.]
MRTLALVLLLGACGPADMAAGVAGATAAGVTRVAVGGAGLALSGAGAAAGLVLP